MNDKEIKCEGCGEIFILRQEESEYYQNRIKGDPKYCPICRKAYRKKQEQKQAEINYEKAVAQKEKDYKAYEKALNDWKVVDLDAVEPFDLDNVLCILGNGFDLMHGAKSSYWDFGKTIGKNSQMKFYLDNYLEVDDLWADFENALSKINVEKMCSPYVLDTHLDMMEAYDPDASAASFFAAAEMAAGPILAMNTELKDRFRKWIGSVRTNTDDRPLKHVLKSGQVLNFNYTEFAETLYGVREENICYIHGSRKKKKGFPREELILGHLPGDSDRQYDFKSRYAGINLSGNRAQILYDAQQTALRYIVAADNDLTKHCDKIIEAHKSFFDELTEINKIITIGHSLYPVDWEYFGEIIRQNDSPQEIKWYFGCYSGADLDRIDAFVKNFGINRNKVFVFRSDLIRVEIKEKNEVDRKDASKKHVPIVKTIGVSDDGCWKVAVKENIFSVIDRENGKVVFKRIFSSYINGAVFDASGKMLLLVIRGLYEGVFLLRFVDGEWKYITELQGIPNQGVITKRLKQVVLQGDKIVFVYNSRIRKYDIADGSLVYNKARNRNKPEEEFIGDDLTQKFQRIYKNGFY